jgi:chromosome segregation ATPase
MPLAAWGPLQDAAAQFRDECAAWEQATHNLFSDLDRLREELSAKAQQLDDGRRRLAERGRQLADQRKETNRLAQLLEHQEARLAEALTELRGLREQLDHERDDSRRREEERSEALQSQVTSQSDQLARMQTERDELKTLLTLAQAEGTSGGASPAQVIEPLLKHFADLKHSMDSTRSELSGAIERVVGRVAQRPAGSSDKAMTAEDLAKMQELQKEHVELESELELVRARAAELQELVQQLKRELVEQRSGMTDELRELRRMLGQQADAPAYPQPAGEEFTESRSEGRKPAMAMVLPAREMSRESVRDSVPLSATADAASHAVMAQFAKLQKDVASRRKKK